MEKKELMNQLDAQAVTTLGPLRGTVATPGIPLAELREAQAHHPFLQGEPAPVGSQGVVEHADIDAFRILKKHVREQEQEIIGLRRWRFDEVERSAMLRKFFGWVMVGCLIGVFSTLLIDDLLFMRPYYGYVILVSLAAWLTA